MKTVQKQLFVGTIMVLSTLSMMGQDPDTLNDINAAMQERAEHKCAKALNKVDEKDKKLSNEFDAKDVVKIGKNYIEDLLNPANRPKKLMTGAEIEEYIKKTKAKHYQKKGDNSASNFKSSCDALHTLEILREILHSKNSNYRNYSPKNTIVAEIAVTTGMIFHFTHMIKSFIAGRTIIQKHEQSLQDIDSLFRHHDEWKDISENPVNALQKLLNCNKQKVNWLMRNGSVFATNYFQEKNQKTTPRLDGFLSNVFKNSCKEVYKGTNQCGKMKLLLRKTLIDAAAQKKEAHTA